MNFENNEEILNLTQRFAKQARDFDDLQNEMAGRDVGRIGRFLPANARTADASGRSKQDRTEALTRLQAMMANNPAYAALFEETANVLMDAQSRLEIVLERVQLEIQRSQSALDEKLERAARLPDGTHVFKDQNGDIRREDGSKVSGDLAATILWNGTEPTLEDVQADRQRLQRLGILADDIHAGQAEIGDMQTEINEDDAPKSEGRLNGVKDRAGEIVDDAEKRFEREQAIAIDQSVSGTPDVTKSAGLAMPEI
ncbi:hypothetical protein [Ruegeria sp. HKCCA0370]|uniref:hypothetical protein n=1 Tax=Ruegeria sp. HKCCA0370 TaxID=2682995 RepID=UPI001489828A|nr:hypothetical protein [Ruegeria sp. HKCCA0370]